MSRRLVRFSSSALMAASLSLLSLAGLMSSGVAMADDGTNYGIFFCGKPVIVGGFFYGCTSTCAFGQCTYTMGDTNCKCK